MADETDVKVTFSADVGPLSEAVARAEAALKALSDTVHGADGAVRSLDPDITALVGKYDAASATWAKAAISFQGVSEALEEGAISATQAQRAYTGIAEAAESATTAASGATTAHAGFYREIVVLGHEVVSGNFSRIPGSMMVLAERSGNLSSIFQSLLSPMGAVVAASLALAAGFYEIGKASLEAHQQIEAIGGTMAAMGRGAEFSRDQQRALTTEIATGFNLSASAVRDWQREVQAIPNATEATREKILELGAALGSLRSGGDNNDNDAKVAIEQLSKAVEGGATAMMHYAEQNGLLSSSLANALEQAKKTGDVQAAQDALLQALTARVGGYGEKLKAANADQRDFNELMAASGGILPVGAAVPIGKPDAATTAGRGPSADESADMDKQRAMVTTTRESLSEIRAAWEGSKSDLASLEAATWQTALAEAQSGGHALIEVTTAIHREITAAQRAAAQATAQEQQAAAQTAAREQQAAIQQQIGEQRLALSETQAFGDQSQRAQVQAGISTAENILAIKGQSADAILHEQQALNEKLGELRRIDAADAATAAENTLKAAHDAVLAARLGSDDRVQAAQTEVATALRLYTQQSEQYRAAQRDLTEATRAGERERAAIARINADTAIALAKINLEAEKQGLDEDVAAHRKSAAEKLAALEGFVKRAADLERQQLESELAAVEGQPEAVARAKGQLLELEARTQAQLAALRHQAAVDSAKEAAADGRVWQEVWAPAQRGFDGMVSGILQGTLTVSQASRRMAGDMVISFAEATAKMMVQFLAFEAAQKLGWMQIATSAATEQSALSKMVLGLESAQLAAHTATESGKTGVTATQTAARTGLQGAESASFLGRLGAQIAGWLGLEIGKTAETGAGAIARSAIQDTETTTAVAAAKTEAAGTIPALTAQAAMGAAAAVAPTPVDGPELALAAAASMNSLGASQLSLASAYGGWAQVPEDGMLAELHRNEMVLPASIANPLRSVAEGGGLGNSGGTTNATFNVSAIDGASVQAFFNNHAALIAKTLGRAQARNPSIGRGS